ncbi:GFA family protein [Bosea sp. (in: a-proteobacteria)]|uniref:GFA family protein n=1 Tax=Bosea vestrisii TaxID=151416 RepID=A0ABW0H4W9_9HYPH|nr:GFA family protein [Bosea sp. (in: a-proteobacteria)]MBR3190605.1 GFA family protein [Bosea sp. (in: a-proteobacteria)]
MTVISGSCHCGATKFEVLERVTEVTACTCSICSKRGALWSYHKPAQFRLMTPRENLTTYRWQSRMVAHHFCGTCGCTTFTESPDWSSGEPDFDNPKVAVNARVLDDFDLAAVPVTVIDGKNLW